MTESPPDLLLSSSGPVGFATTGVVVGRLVKEEVEGVEVEGVEVEGVEEEGVEVEGVEEEGVEVEGVEEEGVE